MKNNILLTFIFWLIWLRFLKGNIEAFI